MMISSTFPASIRALGLAAIVVLALPVLLITIISFNDTSSLVFPPTGFSLKWYLNIFYTDQFLNGFYYSCYLACLSTIVGLAAGITVAFAIARYQFVGRGLINVLVMAPLIVPEVVLGLALLVWFSSSVVGLGDAALIVLHALLVLPYIVRIVVASLQRTDRNLEDAAMLLGASPLRAALRVTLPMIRKGLAAATIFAFVISFQDFTATIFLISQRQTLPVAIFGYIRTDNDPTIAALSTLLIGIAGITVWLTDRTLGIERVG
jgi:ABC-type spermidine/putrescine transport system permease subunit II